MHETYSSCINPDHASLPGHFPGRPVVPGVVLLTELQVALCARLGRNCHITAIEAVKFNRPLLPGQEFSIGLQLSDGSARFTMEHQGQTIAGGKIRFAASGDKA